jgi:AraC-like DNA-binding protein
MTLRLMELLVRRFARRHPDLYPRLAWCGDGLLEASAALRLIDQMRDLTQDDLIGLAVAPCRRGALEFASEVMVRCTTLREAIGQSVRYLDLVTQGVRYSLSEDKEWATVGIDFMNSPNDPDFLLPQWHMIIWHKTAQWMIGAELSLERVELPNPMQSGFAGYAEMFGGNCVFRCPAARLTFPAAYLDRRLIHAPMELGPLYARREGNFTAPRTLSKTWKQLVRRALAADIREGRVLSAIELLAKEFGVSGQTLRRRLRAEGTSYRFIKAQVRREAALEAMSEGETLLGDVSLKAGFAEPNGLSRALRSKDGLSPAQLREQLRQWQGRTLLN